MRRYLPTLLILLALLAVGGLAVYSSFSPTGLFVGYVPTLNPDTQAGQTQALILVVGVVVGVGALIGMGAGLAFAVNQITKMQAHMAAPAKAEGPSRPAPRAAGEAPRVPLSDVRSQLIFWAVLLVVVIGFLILNYAEAKASPVHTLGDMARMPLFKLPGEHIEGLPEFIAGPGDDVTALHIFIAVLGGVLVTTVIAGVGLARGWAVLDVRVKEADKAPRTVVDELLATVDKRIEEFRAPRARRPPANSFDRLLIGLDLLLLLIVAGIVAVYVVPSYGSVAAVDNAVEATRIAALASPTPPPPRGKTPLEVLQEEFGKLPAGDAAAGEATFTSAGCVACHSLQPGVQIVGPSQSDVGTRAVSRKPGYSAELYLYESITRPNAYLVEGFLPDLMPQTFKDTLKPEDLANLIAFLLTLK